MDENNGKLIDNAYVIMEKTYEEIYNMKDIFTEILREMQYEYGSHGRFEYSYGSNAIYMKSGHAFIYMKQPPDEENKNYEYFCIVLLFRRKERMGDYSKKTDIDGPEAWFAKLNVTRAPISPSTILDAMLKKNEGCFLDEIKTGAKKIRYRQEGKDATLDGYWIVCPLVDIKDRGKIEEIIEQLFQEPHS